MPAEDDDDIVHHHSNIEIQPNPLSNPQQPAGINNSQARPGPGSPNPNRMITSAVDNNRPATAAQPAQPPPQQRGQMADDELFNSNIFNNGNDNGQNDDFDFDFESSADEDNAGRQSGGR